MRIFDCRLKKLIAVFLILAAAGCGSGDRGMQETTATFENVASPLSADTPEPAGGSAAADILPSEPPIDGESEWSAATADGIAPPKPSVDSVNPRFSGGGGFPGGRPLLLPSLPPPLPTPPNLSLTPNLPATSDHPTLPKPDAAVPVVPRINAAAPAEATTSVAHVDRIVEQLPYSEIVYNAPETMQFGEPTDIELLLSPTESAESLRAQLQDPTNAVSSEVQTDSRMEAQLSGTGFAIEALSPSLQAVTSVRPTRWRWRVTPTDHGPQQLHLSLLAHIDLPGNDAPLVVETKDALIQVEITLAQRLGVFIEPNWQWLWGAVVFPIIGYRWRRRRHQQFERGAPPRVAA